MIVEHIDELEEIYLAEKVLEDVRAGRETTVDLDDLVAEYGLEDPGNEHGNGNITGSTRNYR